MSRRRRAIIFLLCLPLLAVLIVLDNTVIKNHRRPRPSPGKQTKADDINRYHAQTFTVINIVDGDTLDIDLSEGQSKYTRIRLLGIDAPEMKTEGGTMFFAPESTEFTRKTALGKKVEVFLDETSDTRGKYGRLLAYVKLPDGIFLNELLLSEGFAYADLRFRHSFYNKYRQLESRAHSGKKGLWQKVTTDQMPDWLKESAQ
ncbi:MAG: thermonuclease family protein [Sedimentisphaerales bacterium]|nr:thermonuclease family protein [Sedimentisphaerales bacterium]